MMIHPLNPFRPQITERRLRVCFSSENGFALIASISVMVLLVMISLAMLSLSTIQLRSSEAGRDAEVAKTNARMALMMAIAELQKTTGADTRITAPADALSTSGAQTSKHVRQLTGVWRSWEGLDHDTSTGRPIAPDYDIKGAADQSGSGNGRFLRWLISDDTQDLYDPSNPPALDETSETVPLLAAGTLPSGSDQEVHVVPTEISNDNGRGAVAWWIQGENTKVRLKPTTAPVSTTEAVDQMVVSPGPSGDAFSIEDTSETDKALTQPSLTLVKNSSSSGAADPAEFFHDLTAHSKGLLTNNANGGWKRDLSIFTESFAAISEPFPSLTLEPGEVYEASKQHVGAGAGSALIYPWGNQTSVYPDAVSWSALVEYMTQYRRVQSSGNPITKVPLYSSKTHTDWIDKVRHLPVLARAHLVVSLTAREDTASSTYVPSILITPVITLWNPYSIALDTSNYNNMQFALSDVACPVNFQFKVGADSVTKDLAKIVAHATNNSSNMTCYIPIASPNLWLPGEVRVFSPQGNAIANKNIKSKITFVEGYRPDSGLSYKLLNNANQYYPAQPGTVQYSVGKATMDATFTGPNVKGTGLYFTQKLGTGSNASTTNVQNMLDTDDAQRMLGEEVVLTATSSASLSSLASSPQPVLSVIMGLRYGRDTNPNRDNIMVNGIHNMNPTVGFIVGGAAEADEQDMQARFDGFPYNIQLYAVNSYADPGMPSGITDDLEGYIGSGFGASDGLANLVLLEIPSRPLRTIGALQHFNVNACDDAGPYTLNALGNSRTSPFIESDEIRVKPVGGGAEYGHDHSYAINHVMMDDWFVSSITPGMNDWSANQSRSMEDVYADHLSGSEPLPNHYYSPANAMGVSDAAGEAADFLSYEDAWQKVAAELEVTGMFNVNSTSELAWAMLLKRNFSGGDGPGVLTLNDSTPGNASASASLVENSGTPFPRTLISSDSSAGAGGYTELTQPMRFTDEQIMALAREIVAEVKKRGPFLSLSEFYNRQLSGDSDLAQAGAVESALMRLAEGGSSENPFRDLQTIFTDTASSVTPTGSPLTYPFPAAAEGNPAYGFPGWTRQADVLRPLSGILTARDDTFVIRAYGASKDDSGKVLAEAWCEAVVQRTAEFVDGSDKYALPSDDEQSYGRRYEVKKFRWMNPNEI